MPGPAFKAPGSFPGLDQLPDSVRRALEALFPPDALPMPVATSIGGDGLKQALRLRLEQTPVDRSNPFMQAKHGQGVYERLQDIFSKYMSKVLPQTPSAVPPAPQGLQQLGQDLNQHSAQLDEILRSLQKQ